MDIIIQNKRYSANDVEVALAGNVQTGVTKIDWKKGQSVEKQSAIGNSEAAGYTISGKNYSASVSMFQEDFDAWERGVGGDVLKAKPFPITITFLNPGAPAKKTLLGCIVIDTNNSVNGGSSDGLTVELTLFVIGVK